MKTIVKVTFPTEEEYNASFEKNLGRFVKSIKGRFLDSGTSFETEIPIRDLSFEVEMTKNKLLKMERRKEILRILGLPPI